MAGIYDGVKSSNYYAMRLRELQSLREIEKDKDKKFNAKKRFRTFTKKKQNGDGELKKLNKKLTMMREEATKLRRVEMKEIQEIIHAFEKIYELLVEEDKL
ncbi:Aste57867_21753 [Aphanomyces stellatus]|uniref:Aste57867_21753 protein n=1 Tax=Aphanomyces stellatus TaxID=120398 RepID=A0A485LJ18_9STRA|nr:hypothetical protein As57867_021684 [Aphanomyces stellatus]VFT98422.1 Aste57867_21753 [Aphanomyces stellatus]